jgi:hypothetical protein
MHRTRAPKLTPRQHLRGALLKARAPNGTYVLHGPELRQECVRYAGTTTCSSTVEHNGRLDFLDVKEHLRWSVPIDASETDAGIVVADDRAAYVAIFNPHVACATIRSFAAADGRRTWETFVGFCMTAHSAYSNDIRLTLEHDRLLVWGAESEGRYVTALDLRTGVSQCHRIFDEL